MYAHLCISASLMIRKLKTDNTQRLLAADNMHSIRYSINNRRLISCFCFEFGEKNIK